LLFKVSSPVCIPTDTEFCEWSYCYFVVEINLAIVTSLSTTPLLQLIYT